MQAGRRRRGSGGFEGLIALIAASLAVAGCRGPAASLPPLETVERLDLERYVGRWYEIASLPQYFQRGCVATRADYALRSDGRIRVRNSCRDESLDGPLREAEGVAWVVDPASPGRLAVSFFWPFKGHYWVIELGPSYEYAVIGHPERRYLWILSRTPTLPDALYEALLGRIRAKGYDLEELSKTLQPPAGTDERES